MCHALLAALASPPLEQQSPQQARGTACVWCAVPLTTETAVDLGEQRHHHAHGHYLVFPRGCRPCLRRAANRALQDHAPRCEQCVDDVGQCPTGLALTRAMREARS
jgi:hypothetical protein